MKLYLLFSINILKQKKEIALKESLNEQETWTHIQIEKYLNDVDMSNKLLEVKKKSISHLDQSFVHSQRSESSDVASQQPACRKDQMN